MCGIAGFFSPNQFFSKADLKKMTDCVSHRGPDSEGFYLDKNCGLGHRRLSILDLSESANQPMYSQNEKYVCIYNGEIYNFQEIKTFLEKKGIIFKTTSDTEVLLEWFVEKGEAFVNDLNGIFSIAIYDKIKKELYLFRDRLGIKPLYYFWDNKNFAFASELKSLQSLPQIPKTLNYDTITAFLHLGYIPAPGSVYKNIFKLPSGTFCKISGTNLHVESYWEPESFVDKKVLKDENQATEELDALLKSAVKYQLIADVPLGVFLSGGIDSSTVAAMATQVSGTKLKTFSIGFEEEKFNEAPFAKSVANHLQTDHHEMIVSVKQAQELASQLINVFDEPFADSSAIPTMLVSQMARKQVTVALSGDGGDELFFGYGTYNWAKRLKNPFLNFFNNEVALLLGFGKEDKFRKGKNMFSYPKGKMMSHIFSQEQGFFSQLEIEELLNKDFLEKNSYYFPLFQNPKIETRKLNAMEQQAFFDLNYYLQDDLLVKVDRASMRYGLEVRVPILDHRIVEWALNLSPDLKYRNGDRKYLLKKVLYKYVPEKLFDRPKKGFAIPLADWLKGDLKFLIDEFLNEKTVNQAGIVRYEKVNQLKTAFFNGDHYIFNKIWLLIILHQFLKKENL